MGAEQYEDEFDVGKYRVVKRTILLVDDSEKILRLLERSLRSDFDIIPVIDPTDAIPLAENFVPDLVLLDVHIPNIDGFELLKRFSEHPVTMDVPVIMFSGDDDPKVKELAYEYGASGFLTKPFNYKTIGASIFSVLDGLNSVIENEDTQRAFYTYFNSKMKNQSLKNILLQHQIEDEKVILLSWLPADKVIGELEEDMVTENKLIFLQFKSSLIVKFPYLQDLSIILAEIALLAKEESLSDYQLIIDEPRHLMNLYKSESALSQAMALSNVLYGVFKKVTFLNSKLHDPAYTANLQKLGRVLLGY
ncbi:MAG: hypothetical protein CL674_16825 [Bdellovibrionaceae bacterium]|nr:hypothetical protein [Pseudobdellovibrionaceae bacterium]|tara:strand:+ start:64912 stop:65829 length:918 start_codon:yes stop_codon:yes gene_type:complete